MPEGHTIHRLAADHFETFGGRPVLAASPQGKFADGAALINGQVLDEAEAHGKHLFLGFEATGWVHIHLGLFGRLGFGTGQAPPPTDTVRLRLATPTAYADLRGPTTCGLITDGEKQAIHERLGPDPLRPAAEGAGGERAWARISRSRSTIAGLLMDQKVLAGVGNVYRAEVLFRHGVDPYRLGRDLTRREWDAIWADLVLLMREGVRNNRIDTVRPEHLPEAMNRAPRVDDHGGEVYVYRRARQPCHLCGGEIRSAELAARNLFWCPGCQRR
ncbi:Fpg/Nei family DNA glycosylase [Streptomyces sp. H27-D2]|uniref:Fpg/Nei family DNA glycosylase n=1 Tax=Streptomyces sp. H27-D2 TaxID=3046304 RepID=UPI002DB5F4FB|nr:DNA-formamidopyrimidine glycosylase family protein [Streptomyces sp. H27-D2]MEC4014863.1 DNA-formamidopyrimidine glycosylase family protein [Streptomyces sp. H27-D2]